MCSCDRSYCDVFFRSKEVTRFYCLSKNTIFLVQLFSIYSEIFLLMFEDIVSTLLSTYLGDYLEGLSRKDLKLSLWKGDVELKNLV